MRRLAVQSPFRSCSVLRKETNTQPVRGRQVARRKLPANIFFGIAGFDAIQQEQMVLQYLKTRGRITRNEAVKLCRMSADQASRLLRKLHAAGKLKQQGKGRGAFYVSA